ncbi:hypothetical protein M406DRAFT_281055 [Cryphonectria parasitica EP155]|uniref:FCP1 homology domain-containing protein n=1 Tax=Cryphonectria parasitica (strain ATCC 38755 / EP155) TaxID=660469 RepID=A0A9P4XWZ6_CRYP1|nr:uncharacterized protein M406DRAFT_281055 [Cryphonectria parasitica EP155]KAF3762877.1 hypothetical protein M406DRAFT_281055 [Cryphonectria parasitica EP155]
MNSLNFVSARVSPAPAPASSRSNSLASVGIAVTSHEEQPTSHEGDLHQEDPHASESYQYYQARSHDPERSGAIPDEHTPLLQHAEPKDMGARQSAWHLIPKRIVSAILNSVRWVLSTLAAPGFYLIAYFYDDEGNLAPLRRLFGANQKDFGSAAADEKRDGGAARGEKTLDTGRSTAMTAHPVISSGSSSSGVSSESESELDRSARSSKGSGRRSSRASKPSPPPEEEISPSRRSIRIKLHNEEALRQRKHRKGQSGSPRGTTGGSQNQKDISAQLKSPTSPAGALTKYPRTPAPPRPLIPRRQPSYINIETNGQPPQKTLILDLDETLIHSMSKGGRMSTGHMVEVKLNTTYVGVGGQASIGPQHPILYYVHKRPHCDDFLRRVCKWFNLVVFTASVQEYADPVIDWLESERKFFSARYYRQHCTFRHGAFIKDLSSVEPDLSKVMILDNSPLSYMFHQDNAIPIQGWINDPTDNDLQHLIPFLEGLQYVSDVRALLALRGGEDGQHMVS